MATKKVVEEVEDVEESEEGDLGVKKVVEFEIEGMRPILFDPYLSLPQPDTEEGWEKQAKEKVWRNGKGELCIPAINLKACIREGTRYVGGKKTEGKKRRIRVRAGLFIEGDLLSFGVKKYDEIDKRIVRRSNGAAVPCYRPRLNK